MLWIYDASRTHQARNQNDQNMAEVINPKISLYIYRKHALSLSSYFLQQ